MDCQATTTKFGVIEYMTKNMTKSGQGSLLQVMEHSFSTCMERAKDNNQGVGAAIMKWFNIQAASDVKSQLETMHLAFELPRFLSTRGWAGRSDRSAEHCSSTIIVRAPPYQSGFVRKSLMLT